MKRLFVAALALGAGALVVPAGHAAAQHDIRGGCAYAAYEVTTHGDYRGLMYEVSATTEGGAGTAPIGATVSCWIMINGVEVPGTRHTYGDLAVPGVQAGADPIAFTSQPYDNVVECHSVLYADNTTSDPILNCPAIDPIQIPPQEVLDAVGSIVHIAQNAVCSPDRGTLCALVCPQLQQQAGDYGPMTITPDGDVVVVDQDNMGYNPVFDCPPYVGGGLLP